MGAVPAAAAASGPPIHGRRSGGTVEKKKIRSRRLCLGAGLQMNGFRHDGARILSFSRPVRFFPARVEGYEPV